MPNQGASYGHLGDNSIWPPEALPCARLCSHSPFIEGVNSLELSAKELAKIFEDRRLRKNEKLMEWAKADNAAKRANPTPEFRLLRKKINARRYKSKKAQRDHDDLTRAHYLPLCEKPNTSNKALLNHYKTKLHTRGAGSPVGASCSPATHARSPVQHDSAGIDTWRQPSTERMSHGEGT